jgi:hypothetical protein
MKYRLILVTLAATSAACGGSLPGRNQPLNHFNPLAEDLPCDDYHVEDGSEEGHSTHLGCTGLYASWSLRTLNEGVSAFTPGYELWSDGANKNRWIFLPPGTQIDNGGNGQAGTMDGWIFPVGTKAWKQFSFGDRLVETRLVWKRTDGWFETTYLWSSDYSSAIEHTSGLLVEGVDAEGARYQIPSSATCGRCHGGAGDELLGFEAINLSALRAQGLTLDELSRRALLTQIPDQPYLVPGEPDAEASLGWLHANCGAACHNERMFPGPLWMRLRLQTDQLDSVESTETWRTAMNQATVYWPLAPCTDGPWKRISPSNPDCSTVVYRDSVRDPYPGSLLNQMPPLVSHRVPVDAVETLRRWIASFPAE